MVRLLFILGWLGVVATPENYLTEPHAENYWIASPADVAGARADIVSGERDDDPYRLYLHTPPSASAEAATIAHWSHALAGDFGGRTVHLQGRIRTENAVGAALWLECYAAGGEADEVVEEGDVLARYSTADQFPIHGTHPWTEAGFSVELPLGTTRIVVRAVLEGNGTAEFAELILAPETSVSKPEDAALLEEIFAVLMDELAQLRESNAELADTIRDIEAENATLRDSLAEVAAVLETLESEPTTDSGKIPPLVPHGEHWEALR